MSRRQRVPPLPWIRVFESAARQGSFLSAGKELSISAAAVSRSIKELEGFIGVELFLRRACGVRLTEAGRRYAAALTPALRQIAVASADARATSQKKLLRINSLPVLAQRWLLPRLAEFGALNPDISVAIATNASLSTNTDRDATQGEFDVILRDFKHRDESCEEVELFGEEIFPVMSPMLAARAPLRTPADLFRVTALRDDYWEMDWPLWLGKASLRPPAQWREWHFPDHTLAIEAAMAGCGVLMGHSPFIQRELRSGELVALFPLRVIPFRRYYARAPEGRAIQPAARMFLDWLKVGTRLGGGTRRSCDGAIPVSDPALGDSVRAVPAAGALGHCNGYAGSYHRATGDLRPLDP